MKTFFATLGVFVLLLALIVINCLYISHTMRVLEQQLLALPYASERVSAVDELERFWKTNRTLVGISVSYNDIREMEKCLIQMRTAATQEDELSFENARMQALCELQHMRRLERFSAENMLCAPLIFSRASRAWH